MIRLSIAFFLAFIGMATPSASFAQASVRAYAPENIWQLTVNDQIRVIDNEYNEQSRGRQIPDDQLDFYLDQIRLSRWTFSKIKSDIATSLRGNGGNNGGNNGGWFPPTGGNWNQTSVICSSDKQRYRECRAPFRGRARLIENISKTRCIEGRNWGSRQNMIWVNGGCRGRFSDLSNGNGGNQGYSVTCSSFSGQYRSCAWDRNRGTPRLIERISGRCTERYDWGFDNNRGLWVANSCSARFGVR